MYALQLLQVHRMSSLLRGSQIVQCHADATHAGVTVENAIELLTQLEISMFGVTVSSLEDRKARQQEAFDKAIINPFFLS